MRKKRVLVWLVVAGVAGAAASMLAPPPSSAPDAPRATAAASGVEAQRGQSGLAALPAREPIGRERGQLFSSRSWTPPAPPPAAAPAPVAAAPLAPPMPYRVAGMLAHDGGSHVVLAKGDRVFTVRAGDALEDGYRVESVAPGRVTLTYVPLGLQQHLALAPALAPDSRPASTPVARPAAQSPALTAARPAQLRWEGPERVQAGASFNVALKVTSAQPVRASPLQLSFDAKLLEAVAVRAGGFFADGSFSYRINPAGSIFVGAMGKGNVAADAEFLVVTFKPIRPGATAELTLSALTLQGAGGVINHDQPVAFRTAIVQ